MAIGHRNTQYRYTAILPGTPLPDIEEKDWHISQYEAVHQGSELAKKSGQETILVEKKIVTEVTIRETTTKMPVIRQNGE